MGDQSPNNWPDPPNLGGRPPLFTDPKDLWLKAKSYFDAMDATNFEAFGSDDKKVRKTIPYTLEHLQVHMQISNSTWYTYKNDEKFLEVCEHIDKIIYSQKFIGATTGIFNHAIVTRKLGLADKADVDVKQSGELVVKNEYHIHPVTADKSNPKPEAQDNGED